ncbi:MAG: SPOR domain-containing protein [Inquilinaceae bacterium]
MADWRLDELTDPYTNPPETGPRPKSGTQPGGFRAHKLRALATSAIVVLALGGFSAIMVYAYKSETASDPAVVPLIRADISPTRIRPERPGGLQIPYQDRLLLREGAGRTTELSALEGPAVTEDLPRTRPLPQAGSPIAGTPTVNPTSDDGPAVPAVPVPSVESASASARNANTGAQHAAAISDRVTQARTRGIEQVRYPGTEALIPRAPRGASMPDTAARPSYLETLLARAPATTSLTAPQPSLDPGYRSSDETGPSRPPETASDGVTDPALDPVVSDEPSTPAPVAASVSEPAPEIMMAALPPRPRVRPDVAAAATPAAASPAPPATTAPALQADGDYRVQLASVSSDEAARGEWERLQRQHPALLAGLGVTVRKAQVNGRDYYRVQAGPLDKTGAASLCGALKAANGDCLVTGP